MAAGNIGGRYVVYRQRPYNPMLPPGVKWLLISNFILFVVYFFAVPLGFARYFEPFWLSPRWVIQWFVLWQFGSYLFLHDPTGFQHILFNMLSLWMFGKDLENLWGTRKFLQYYFLCGVGAGFCVIVGNLLFGSMDSRTIGASGAIYGLLLAFGMLFPDATVLFSFLFPIKAKYFVMIIGAITFMLTFRSTGDGVSHVAHLGGMIFGYVYLKTKFLQGNLLGPIGKSWRNWRQERAKRRFQVYLKKQNGRPDRDRFVH